MNSMNDQVNIPNASNACSGFDDSYGWTFFDLNAIRDEHKDDPVTIIQADFVSTLLLFSFLEIGNSLSFFWLFFLPYGNFLVQYHANEFLPLKDEQIVGKVMSFLSKCITDFENTRVIEQEIGRFPKSLTHFYPGNFLKVFLWNYKSMPVRLKFILLFKSSKLANSHWMVP